MSIMASDAGAFKAATGLWASLDGAWHEVPLGGGDAIVCRWPGVGGRNGIMAHLAMLLRVRAGVQTYINPASNTPSGTPGYPVGGYPADIPTVAATVTNQVGASGGWRAFDGSLVTDGSATAGGDAIGIGIGSVWLCDFGVRKLTLEHLGIQARNDNSWHRAPRNFKIQGSNDNALWEDLFVAVATGPSGSAAWWVSPPITNSTPFRYIRILLTGNDAQNGPNLVMGEVEMWGTLT